MRARRRPFLLLVAGALIALLVLLVLGVTAVQRWLHDAAAQPPAVGTTLIAPTQSKAQQALDATQMNAETSAATDYLANQPTAYWLTPEQDPIGTAGATVAALSSEAREQDASLAVVVYGLPERDCNNHSAGGLSTGDYRVWVDEIGAALAAAPDVQKIVVLEPDSLALAPECGNLDERVPQLRDAVDALGSPDTWIYLDGGHSSWLPVDEMAAMIKRVDVGDRIRGFATNVSNYRSTHDEFTYAHELSARLDGLHAVVDTSRNGAASAGDEWCNPPGQRVGDAGGTFGDDVVDTNLWIKPPGESDGPCNGGPPAGVWWPEGAAELSREVD